MAIGLWVEYPESSHAIIQPFPITIRRLIEKLEEFAIAERLNRLATDKAVDPGDTVEKRPYAGFVRSKCEEPYVWVIWTWLLVVARPVAVKLTVVVDEENAVWSTNARTNDGGSQRSIKIPGNCVERLVPHHRQELACKRVPFGLEADLNLR